ncbi:hypothetical protein [Pollutimonas nitritireducens]|nr:hypothetical protein [Pollutimonas nitritireducens]
MATQSTQKKQPFVIEPLNWVAPEVDRDDSDRQNQDGKQATGAKESRS